MKKILISCVFLFSFNVYADEMLAQIYFPESPKNQIEMIEQQKNKKKIEPKNSFTEWGSIETEEGQEEKEQEIEELSNNPKSNIMPPADTVEVNEKQDNNSSYSKTKKLPIFIKYIPNPDAHDLNAKFNLQEVNEKVATWFYKKNLVTSCSSEEVVNKKCLILLWTVPSQDRLMIEAGVGLFGEKAVFEQQFFYNYTDLISLTKLSEQEVENRATEWVGETLYQHVLNFIADYSSKSKSNY